MLMSRKPRTPHPVIEKLIKFIVEHTDHIDGRDNEARTNSALKAMFGDWDTDSIEKRNRPYRHRKFDEGTIFEILSHMYSVKNNTKEGEITVEQVMSFDKAAEIVINKNELCDNSDDKSIGIYETVLKRLKDKFEANKDHYIKNIPSAISLLDQIKQNSPEQIVIKDSVIMDNKAFDINIISKFIKKFIKKD